MIAFSKMTKMCAILGVVIQFKQIKRLINFTFLKIANKVDEMEYGSSDQHLKLISYYRLSQ